MSIKKFTPPTYQNWGNLGFIKSLVLMVVMIVTTSNAYAQAHFEVIDGLRYLIDEDANAATLVANPDEKYSGDIIVPETIKARDGKIYAITALADKCFFYCSSLTSISMSSSITSIGSSCFNNCTSLSSITLPSSITLLEDECFYNCLKLRDISIPNSITSLGKNCFSHCKSLTNLNIPNSVTSLGDDCFSGCSNLTNITIPSSVSSIGKYCFSYCESLTNLKIPNSVTSIRNSCFAGCTSLTSITIPSSITSLGSNCFNSCISLTSIKIPSSVTSFGEYCFSYCTKLETIYFDGKLPQYTILTSIPTTCIIYVPKEYLQDYKDEIGSKYSYIYAWNSREDSPTDKCMVPTITYADGKLRFESSTKGAEYHYTITDSDIAKDSYSQDGEVALSATYAVSAYATADGYQPSDKATATLYWINANLKDEPSTNINTVKTRGIVATSNGGVITLSGLDNGEVVTFYDLDGKQIGMSKAENGTASYAVGESIVIAKFSNNAIKIKSN